MATDNELETLVAIAKSLKTNYVQDENSDPWANSPFAWIKSRPSRQVGKIGEQLVAEWCRQKNFIISRCGDPEADLVLNGHRIEVKFSTLWEGGNYTFQQLRDQNYEFAFFLGLSPFAAHGWFVSKMVLRQHVIGHTPQHAGKTGSDTFWISFPANNPPNWLAPFGGSISQVYEVIRRTLG